MKKYEVNNNDKLCNINILYNFSQVKMVFDFQIMAIASISYKNRETRATKLIISHLLSIFKDQSFWIFYKVHF